MRAGTLRHQITIEKYSTGRDTYGAQTKAWSSGLNTFADIQPLRGSEYFAAQEIQAGISHKVRIRNQTMINSTAINTTHRIKFGSRYLNILSIIKPSERNIMLEMMCSEDV